MLVPTAHFCSSTLAGNQRMHCWNVCIGKQRDGYRWTRWVSTTRALWADIGDYDLRVVLENSNVAKLASNPYLSVRSLRQEDPHDTDDASAGEIYAILMPASAVSTVQSARRRQHGPSVVDRDAPTHRTAALHRIRPEVLRTG